MLNNNKKTNYGKPPNNQTICYVVRNFLRDKRGETPKKSAPRDKKKKRKTPDHSKRGNSNVLANGPIIRVPAVKIISPEEGG